MEDLTGIIGEGITEVVDMETTEEEDAVEEEEEEVVHLNRGMKGRWEETIGAKMVNGGKSHQPASRMMGEVVEDTLEQEMVAITGMVVTVEVEDILVVKG